jgi:hypothetical protein
MNFRVMKTSRSYLNTNIISNIKLQSVSGLGLNLVKRSEMIMFGSLLTTFKASGIFGRNWGSSKKLL